jgi:hypothetical protein
MKSFLFGTVFGISVGTVGFSGVAPMLDSMVNTVKKTTIEMSNSSPNRSSYSLEAPAAPLLPQQADSNWDEKIRQELAKQQQQ